MDDDRAWLAGAIERNCDALLRIVVHLVAILRHPCGGMKDSLPPSLYFGVLRILRPAESAVRRLVVLEAIGLEIEAASPPKASPSRPAATNRNAAKRKRAEVPAFQIFDPFKPLPDSPWITGDDRGDPFAGPAEPSTEPRDATQLAGRVQALIGALVDLPAQARRLALWRLKRERPRRWSSLRPGFPPGYRRRRPEHEVDEVLRECERLVAWAHAPPESR